VTDTLLFKGIDEPGLNTIDVYMARGGYTQLPVALKMKREDLITELSGSGLRGRGGAGFPMGKKASFIPKGDMQKYVVCNADESEPGTFKDRELIQKNPHQLIEGLLIAAFAVDATINYIYIRGEYDQQANILDAAIAEARARGIIGENIFDSGFNVHLELARGAGAYICGEETGLLDSLEGKRGNPRLKPPFPANEGLFNGPTLINNVETLSAIPSIIKLGAEGYAAIGVKDSAGTKLVSISGNVERPGNYEVALGTSSRELIYGLAGGPVDGRKVKCWFPGGSSTPVLTADDLDVNYDYDSLEAAGSMLGSGAIIVVDETQSVVELAYKLAKFYSHESCGKCTPCREGTRWTFHMVERIKEGTATPMDLDIMAAVQEQIIGHCLCVLGDAMAMPIGSLIAKFRDEFEAEIEENRNERERKLAEEFAAAEVEIEGITA